MNNDWVVDNVDDDKDVRTARQVLTRVPGSSCSLVIADEREQTWVVKFKHNPRHHRLIINEYLGTRLALEVGLTLPAWAPIRVSESLLRKSHDTPSEEGIATFPHSPGIHFGRIYAPAVRIAGLKAIGGLPTDWKNVLNITEIAGVLAFDAWVSNTNVRQAILLPIEGSRYHNLSWIDHGNCFGDASWRLDRWHRKPIFTDNPVYRDLTGWSSLQPWLQRIEDIGRSRLLEIAASIPNGWIAGEEEAVENLIDQLDSRRRRLQTLLIDVIHSNKRAFPKWPSRLRSFQPKVLSPAEIEAA